MCNMHSFYLLPFFYSIHSGPLLNLDGKTAHRNSKTRIAKTEEKASISRSGGIRSSSCAKNCCHGWGSVSFRYPQSHNKLHQQHSGGCSHLPPIKIWSIDSPRTSLVQVHLPRRQDTILGTQLRPYFCRQRNSWVFQHLWNIIYPASSREYFVCDYSQDKQVLIVNSRVESYEYT